MKVLQTLLRAYEKTRSQELGIAAASAILGAAKPVKAGIRQTAKLARAATVIGAVTFMACGTGDDSTDVGASEIATATVAGAARSGSSGAIAAARVESLALGGVGNNRCATPLTSGDGCSVDSTGKVMTLSFDSCNYGNNSAVWAGSEILESSSPVSCGSHPSDAPGETLLRTFGPGTTRTIGSSVHVSAIDTTAPSGYSTPVSGGTLIRYVTDAKREIDIRGVHVLSQKVFRGSGNAGRVEVEADHTVSTPVGKPLTMTVSGGSRVVSGEVVVQHNDLGYTGTSVFKDVTFSSDSGCCLPVSGTVTTTLTGSREQTQTVEFAGGECGAAKARVGDADLKDVVLNRCF